jgi:hypothetical protein
VLPANATGSLGPTSNSKLDITGANILPRCVTKILKKSVHLSPTRTAGRKLPCLYRSLKPVSSPRRRESMAPAKLAQSIARILERSVHVSSLLMPSYSCRNATMGSTLVARRAGM